MIVAGLVLGGWGSSSVCVCGTTSKPRDALEAATARRSVPQGQHGVTIVLSRQYDKVNNDRYLDLMTIDLPICPPG